MARNDELDTIYTYHPPKGEDILRYETIRSYARDFAAFILKECPDSRERSLALTKLEEVVMWANASVARRGK